MDAYVFIRRASRAVVKALAHLHDEMPERVRAVATMTGAYDALVFVDVEGINQLEELVKGALNAILNKKQKQQLAAMHLPGHSTPEGCADRR